jgi:hypothetical protein
MRDDPIGLVLAIYRVVPVLIESGAEDLARDLFAFYSDWDPGRAGPVGAALWGAVEGLIASTRDSTANEAVALLSAAGGSLRERNAHTAAAQCNAWLGCRRTSEQGTRLLPRLTSTQPSSRTSRWVPTAGWRTCGRDEGRRSRRSWTPEAGEHPTTAPASRHPVVGRHLTQIYTTP